MAENAIDRVFARSEPQVRTIVGALIERARQLPGVVVDPKGTCLHLNHRTAFAGLHPRRNALLLNLQHVISDGWSMGVLVREVTALYAAAVARRPLGEALPPLPVQYADFSVWQSRRLSGETLQREIWV